MNTNLPQFAVTNNLHPCASTVVRAKNDILSALKIQAKVILLTGKVGTGKSTLLRSIANEISHNHRLIFFDGNDSASSSNDEYKFVEKFICESNQLDERIVIIIDAAELVPEETLSHFLLAITTNEFKNNNPSVLLSGLPECKEKLDKMLGTLNLSIAHSTLDRIGEEELRFLTAKKDYQIKPYKDEYKFEADAIKKLSSYVNNDLKLADVALEWCIAVANYSNTDILSSSIIDDAIECMQKYASDSNAELTECYPSSIDVVKYLGNFTSGLSESDETEANFTATRDRRNRPFISESAFQTIDLNDPVIPKLDFETDLELDLIADLEDETISDTEVIPKEWVTTSKSKPQRKAAYITAFTLCALIIISFIAIENKPFFDTAFNRIEAVKNNLIAASTQSSADTAVIDDDSNIVLEDIDSELADIDIDEKTELLTAKQTDDQLAITDRQETDRNDLSNKKPIPTSSAKSDHEPLVTEDISVSNETDQNNQTEQSASSSINETNLTKLAEFSATEMTETIPPVTEHPVAEQLQQKRAETDRNDLSNKKSIPTSSAKPDREPLVSESVSVSNETDQNSQIEQSASTNINETNLTKLAEISATEVTETTSPVTDKPLKIAKISSSNSDDDEIEVLIELASRQFAAKQLTTPAGDNALETYRKILSLKPEHALALQGIGNIHSRYLNWANYYLQQNETDRSRFFYEKAFEIDPTDLASKQMADTLKQKLSKTDESNVVPETGIHETNVPEAGIQEMQQLNATQEEKLQTNINNSSSPFNIDGLLLKARQQLQDKQLTTPTNNNAYETYIEVLKVEPDNAAAIRGISLIKNSYILWAEADIKQNELQRAALFYRKALEIDPQDTRIARRLDEITNSIATNYNLNSNNYNLNNNNYNLNSTNY